MFMLSMQLLNCILLGNCNLIGRFLAFLIIAHLALWSSTALGQDAPAVGSTFQDCPTCPTMVVITPGSFSMGMSASDKEPEINSEYFGWRRGIRTFAGRATPVHQVTIDKAFAIGKFEITKAEYSAYIKDTNYNPGTHCTFHRGDHYIWSGGAGWDQVGFPQSDRDPVVCVSWADITGYLNWLNKKSDPTNRWRGLGPYRLLTEDEWEYAARGGAATARWWGTLLGSGNANCRGCSDHDLESTRPVEVSPVNPFGVGDALGNVWQVVADCWHETYNGSISSDAAWTIEHCNSHVIRGGSWGSEPYAIRSASRGFGNDNEPSNDIGFRVAKTIQ